MNFMKHTDNSDQYFKIIAKLCRLLPVQADSY
jgi:hypothetical protein